ncbi:MAG: TRAP transporter large permease [Candidatus Electryonea clarkiae]|nr:TRAP transporter large permease [Candidatus Electryonea clarkiae]MDP8288154.1 TRAP transporter large permease [Candidatus Electryonea clarkiae]
MITVVIIFILLLAIAGAPLFAVLAALAIAAFLSQGIEPVAVIIELYRMAAQPTLVAIPLFTYAGYLLAESGAPKRLVRVSHALFGWMPGGLAIVALATCSFFTAFTGASGVTIVALGGLLFPVLMREGYPEKFSVGLLTSSGSLGLLFPPSLPIILYALIASISVDELFAAGVLPGLLLVIILSLYSIRIAKKESLPTQKFSWKEALAALKEAGWELPLPLIILVGIYGGFFTAVEAAAITAAYLIFVEVVIRRDIHPIRDLPRITRDSTILVGGILLILGSALGLTNYLIDAQAPEAIFEFMRGAISSKWTFLIALNIFLLIVGSLMDIFSAIIVVVPLILPIAQEFGVNPIHLGIIFLTNLEIGYSTPPVGLNLFISSFRFKKPIVMLYKAALPFIGMMLIALMIITYWEDLSMFLVRLIFGGGE